MAPGLLAVLLAACAGSGSGPPPGGAVADPADDPSPRENVGDPQEERGAAPMVQPGAPGEATRSFDAGELAELGGVAFTEADVHFMQGMIPHHAQALHMTALVEERSASEGVRLMALRMEISQRDEIALMERWLRERGQEVPAWSAVPPGDAGADTTMDHAADPAMDHGADHAMHGGSGMAMMPGMLTPEQMTELRAATGTAFDRLFLEYMIQHHDGAVIMVRDLFAARGGGQESEIFQFASHVDADQTAEIRRMRALLESLR